MAAVSIDMTSFQDALKYKFHPDRLKLIGYRDNPLYAICPKRTDFGGQSMLMPAYHAGGRGKGTSITYAQGNQTQAATTQYVLTRAKLYSVAEVDRQTLKASVGDPHAWLEARTALMEERVYEMTRDLALDLYGTGTGSRGRIGTAAGSITVDTPAAGTDRITLEDPEDIVHFEAGMYIGATATDGGTLRDITGADYLVISAVDRSNGYIFVTGNTDAGTAWAVGDYLVEQGDENAKIKGLRAWVPATAPTSGDSFFGVDRSADTTRLAGIRYDGSGQSVHEAIIDAGTAMFREGGRATLCFANPVQVAEVAKALQGQAVYDPVKSSDGKVGFDALRVRTGAGTVKLVSDPNCPVDSAFMLDPDALCLWSLGETIEMVDEDGQVLLRSATADTFEVRFAFYGQFVVRTGKLKNVCHITLS